MQGFGNIAYVGDKSLNKVEFYGQLSIDDKAFPGLVKNSEKRFANSAWKEEVVRLLRRSDIAVVDISDPSENVIWEIMQCYKYLLPQRIIFLANFFALRGENKPQIVLSELSRNKALNKVRNFKRVLIYYDVGSVYGQQELGAHLTEAMSNIVSTSY